jgi:hypothetical protein
MAFLSRVEHLPFQASHLYDEQDSRVSTGWRKKPAGRYLFLQQRPLVELQIAIQLIAAHS